jgi:hypothetical protein
MVVIWWLFGGKITKSRAQNKETRFFFCRDGVISPSMMEKLINNYEL